jgi:hypothetical protein
MASLVLRRGGRLQDREFVAAKTRDGIGFTHAVF